MLVRLIILSLRTVAVISAVTVLVFISLQSVKSDDSMSKEHIVEIRNLEFIPKELVVAPGDTIIWINHDIIPHTVTAGDESWDSDLVEAEGQWQTIVKANMHETYFCRYHPSMKAKLRIVSR